MDGFNRLSLWREEHNGDKGSWKLWASGTQSIDKNARTGQKREGGKSLTLGNPARVAEAHRYVFN